jgi:hypothetical protein
MHLALMPLALKINPAHSQGHHRHQEGYFRDFPGTGVGVEGHARALQCKNLSPRAQIGTFGPTETLVSWARAYSGGTWAVKTWACRVLSSL